VVNVSWERRFRIRQYLKGSLWVVPLAGAALGTGLAYVSIGIQAAVGTPIGWKYSPSTALTVLTAVVSATAALTGFVVTVSVLIVQMATGTFSARYMRIWYRDIVLKATLAVLLGTMLFSYSLLRRIDTSVPNLGVTAAGVFLAGAVVLFLLFLDRSIQRMRPVKVAALVAEAGRRTALATADVTSSPTEAELGQELLAGEPSLAVRAGSAGSIMAIDRRGLVAWAERHDCVLVLPEAVGDFASTGTTLVEVFAAGPLPADAERELRRCVALGVERTIDQDTAFALRVMVDIAIRALSAAVNDPTTAVQVLDHLGETLATIGRTPNLDGRATLRDDAGRPRVLMPEQRWEDYLSLALTEIRVYGANAIQVARRLRMLLEELRPVVLPEYEGALDRELERLDATVEASFANRVDLDLARIGDRQGIGGPVLSEARRA
jgi:uncharacterized membrane protein